MTASRLFLCCAFFLVASAPAYAHGGAALMVVVTLMSVPVLLLIFLPVCAMSGMAGRRWKAFGLYLVALAAALVLQWQDWYQPFARMFPTPEWLQDQVRFVLIPPFDLLMWLALAVVAIYLLVRDRRVPIGVSLTLPPASNLLWGSAFTIASIAPWAYVLFDAKATSWIASWPEGIGTPFLLIWSFILPVVLAFTAIHLFRNGLRFGRNRSSR